MQKQLYYYPFGSPMTSRSFSASSYRYGFNGKEKDEEMGTQDYGMRIYNPALGKFLSVDPLTASFPWNSTYAFCENRPIDGLDLDGGEYYTYLYKQTKTGTTLVAKFDYTETKEGQGSRGPGVLVKVVGMDGKIREQFIKSTPKENPVSSSFNYVKRKLREFDQWVQTESESNPNLPDKSPGKDLEGDGKTNPDESPDKPYQGVDGKQKEGIVEKEKTVEDIENKKGDSTEYELPGNVTLKYDKSEVLRPDPAASNDLFNARVVKDGTKDKIYKQAEKRMDERRKSTNENK